MSNPRNKSSVKEDSELLDIMSEELCNRLHMYDDFVWVDCVPGAQPGYDALTTEKDKNKSFEASLNEHISTTGVVTKVVQSSGGRGVIDNDFDEEGTTGLEDDYFEEFYNVKYKPANLIKTKYPVPQWIKRKEHGTFSININKMNIKDENYELLPKIKLDASTIALLEKLIHNRYLRGYGKVIGRGKKSIVIHACCHWQNCMMMPFHNAVKVYKLDTNQDNNNIVFKRVQREFEHLKKVEKLMHTPWPIRAWKNVIVMSCYNFEQDLSLAIKDIPSEMKLAMYQAIVEFMERAYNITDLVHGKLCSKNIVFFKTYPYFIGWSHSVKSDHPQALSKLMKDCKFVTEFFVKHGVNVISTEALFMNITGVNKISNKLTKLISDKDLFQIYNTNPNRMSHSLIKPKKNFRFK